METQTIVEYEVVDLVSDENFFTYDRYVALEHYEQGAMIYERHSTMGNPSRFVQAEQIVTIMWNNNPEFEEEDE